MSDDQLIYKRPGSIESLESYDPVNSVSDHVTSATEFNKNEEEGAETLYDWMKRQAAERSDGQIMDEDEDEIMTIKIQESLNNEGDFLNITGSYFWPFRNLKKKNEQKTHLLKISL